MTIRNEQQKNKLTILLKVVYSRFVSIYLSTCQMHLQLPVFGLG